MNRNRAFLTFCATLLLPLQAFGAGLCLYEIGTTDLRLASAGWAARAEDASTVFTNPAGMSRLCGQAMVGIQPIYAHFKFNPNSQTTISGGSGNASAWLPAGGFYALTPINDDVTVGFAACGYWGSALNFGSHWAGRYTLTKTQLQGFSAIPAFSYRCNNWISVGVGVNLMYGVFDQQSALNNSLLDPGTPDGLLKMKAGRMSVGALAGVLFELSECTRVGVQYLSQVKLDFKAKPHFQGAGPNLTAALAATGLLDSSVRLGIHVPNMVMASLYQELNSCWSIMGNVGWQQWSKFGRVDLILSSPTSRTFSATTKYKDSWHVAGGLEYRWDCRWKFSGGVAYDSDIIPTANVPLSLPVGQQWRFGTGAQYTNDGGFDLSFGYEFLWTGDLSVSQNPGPLAGRVVGTFANCYSHFISVVASKRF